MTFARAAAGLASVAGSDDVDRGSILAAQGDAAVAHPLIGFATVVH